MKHLGATVLMAAVFCMTASAVAHPVPRTVLLESFTNVSCAGCTAANLVTKQVVDELGNNTVVNLQVHLSWPESADPFYTANIEDNFFRTLFYEIASAPDLRTNGFNLPNPGDHDGMVAAINEHHDTLSPLSIALSHQLDGTDLTVEVGVKAVAAPPSGDLVLYVAVVDEAEHYDTPPGDNGETDFYWTLRDLVPNFNGTTFTITEGDSLTFSLPSTIAAEWLDTDLHVLAWVQDAGSKEVLQAATTAPPAAYAADYYAERYGKVSPVDVLYRFDGWLVNAGTQTDTYDFQIVADTPGWEVSACVGLTCFPPWITEFTVTVDPGEEVLIAADVKPLTSAATGSVTMICTSQADPGVQISRTFVLISPGAEVLYVDTDAAQGYAPYFTNALTAAGRTWSAWDIAALGRPDDADLGAFTLIVWNTEGALPGLSDDERAQLGTYLDSGGDLLLSGQDLAYGLCDLNSPYFNWTTLDWYEHHTGAVYAADDAQDSSITGPAGDPVGDGLAFSLAGGDGAGNQDYPDVLTPVNNARACLEYSPGQGAAIRFARGEARMVTLGFGFEGIGENAARNTLMTAVLDWFDDTTVSVPDGASPPTVLADAAVYPNPFNPTTDLVFSLVGDNAVDTRIDIYDMLGRRVRHLFAGSLPTGDHRLKWDGRDDEGAAVAGGLYLAILRAGDMSQTLKMSLVK